MYQKVDETEVAGGLKLLPGEHIELAFSFHDRTEMSTRAHGVIGVEEGPRHGNKIYFGFLAVFKHKLIARARDINVYARVFGLTQHIVRAAAYHGGSFYFCGAD